MKSRLTILIGIALILAVISPAASFAATPADLNITAIVQQDRDFLAYLSITDDTGSPVPGEYYPDQFSVQIGANAAITPEYVAPASQVGGVGIIVAVDISGSITTKELKGIQSSLSALADRITNRDIIRLITIGSEVTTVVESSNDASALKSVFSSKITRSDRKTCLFEGLTKAIDSVRNRPIDGPSRYVVLLFTDGGDDSDGSYSEATVKERLVHAQLPIYVIGLKGNSGTSLDAVNRLALASGGKLYKADNSVEDVVRKAANVIMDAQMLVVSPPFEYAGTSADWTISVVADNRSLTSNRYNIAMIPWATPIPVVTPEPTPVPTPEPTPVPTPEPSAITRAFNWVMENWLICLAIFIALLILLIVVLLLRTRQSDSEVSILEEEEELPTDIDVYNDDKTIAPPHLIMDGATIPMDTPWAVEVTLAVTCDDETKKIKRKMPINSKLLIGRSADICDIVLEGAHISREHILLTMNPDGLMVKNLSKTTGTYLNKEKLEIEHALRNDDELQLGKTTIVVSISR